MGGGSRGWGSRSGGLGMVEERKFEKRCHLCSVSCVWFCVLCLIFFLKSQFFYMKINYFLLSFFHNKHLFKKVKTFCFIQQRNTALFSATLYTAWCITVLRSENMCYARLKYMLRSEYSATLKNVRASHTKPGKSLECIETHRKYIKNTVFFSETYLWDL